MKTVLRLIKKDLIRFFNDRPAMLLSFIVPMALIVVFGNIFGGSGPRGKVSMLFVNESNSIVAKLLENKLDSAKSLILIKRHIDEKSNDTIQISEQKAIELIRSGKSSSAALVLTKDFFSDTSSSLNFKFYYDPKNDIESALIQGTVQQTIMTQIPRIFPVLLNRQAVKFLGSDSTGLFIRNIGNVVQKYFNVPVDSFIRSSTRVDSSSLFSSSQDTSGSANIIGNLIKFDNQQLVGKEITNPGLTRTVGGWAIMFLLFSITGAATSLFEEKQEGTLKRLLCMPVKRSQIILSKYIYTILFGTFQLLVLFFFSWIVFGVDIFSNFTNLLIVIIASAAAAVSFGMLVTSVAKSMNQANGISMLIILVMSAVGGSWFPTSFLPDWMQAISKMTMTYWSVEAFLQVLWRDGSLLSISTNLIILLSMALLLNAYALARFRNLNLT
ncbi:MAG TPA: ABC transporter permease [Melioribacteraceae bacterium]|nr:ABC transporter permease [Melioribacteraceae bacterium]